MTSAVAKHAMRRFLICVVVVACVIVACAWNAGDARAEEHGHPVVVALGDSYSSGEGTEPFYDQETDAKFESEDWLAHRSKKAWPGLLSVGGTVLNTIKDKGWYFAAASGAKTNHVLGTDDPNRQEDKKGTQTKEWNRWSGPVSIEQGKKQLPCQSNMLAKHAGAIDYVTLTMGGNDLGFEKIVSTAATDLDFIHHGGLKKELEGAINRFEGNNGVKSTLLHMYDHIHNVAGSQTQVVVAGYPHLFAQGGSFPVSADRARLINAAVNTFDAEMKAAVDSSGKDYVSFVDVRREFMGHEGQFMNGVMLFAQEQDIKRDFVSSYSVHPNEHGHAAYARAVQARIDELENRVTPTSEKPSVAVSSDVAMSLVFDVSGSMDDASALGGMSKLVSAKQQSTAFVSSVQREGGIGGMSIKVGVASFSTKATTNCGLSNNPNDINESINGLRANDRTNIYAGLAEGIKQLESDDGEKLLVFLSDGLSNEGPPRSDIIRLAHHAADERIKIYTIGFGRSNDLDESLLQEIASITGGEYSHEDSSEIMSAAVGLFASMMNAGLSASSQVLMSETGTVQQGQTVDVGTFDVSGSGTVQAYLYWPGSTLDLLLTDPEGKAVSAGYMGYAADTSSIPTVVTIANAKAGTWKVSVYGKEVSMASEPFYAAAAISQATPTQAPVGGGAAPDNANGLLFLVVVVAAGCVLGVFALSRRKGAS